MRESLSPAIFFLVLFLPQISLAQSYPSACDATAQAIIISVGGCSLIDPVAYDNIAKKCCVSRTTQATTLAPVVNISATPQTVNYNQNTTLTWASTNASSCTASGDWSGNKSTSFYETVGPLTSQKVFRITCFGLGGTSNTAEVKVNINTTQNTGINNLSSCNATAQAIVNSVGGCSHIDASAYPNVYRNCCSVSQGPNTTNAINTANNSNTAQASVISNNLSRCDATAQAVINSVGGCSHIDASAYPNIYQKCCRVSSGSNTLNNGTARVGGLSPTMVFVVDHAQINKGQRVNFSWSSTNADGCFASGSWSGSKGTSGNEMIGPLNGSKIFGLTCKSASGEARKSIAVVVQDTVQSSMRLPAQTQTLGQTAPLQKKIPVPIKKAAKQSKSAGSDAAESISPPIISFSASSAHAEGGSTTLVWAASNADSCTALGSWSGKKATSGSENARNIMGDSTYVLICSGRGGEASKTIKIAAIGKSKGVIATLIDGIVRIFTSKIKESPVGVGNDETSAAEQVQNIESVKTLEGAQERDTPEEFTGPPEVTLTTTPIVRSGQTATIEWETQNVSNCIGSGAWSGGKNLGGKEISATLNADTSYALTCIGRGREIATATSTVVVYTETVAGTAATAIKNLFGNIFSK